MSCFWKSDNEYGDQKKNIYDVIITSSHTSHEQECYDHHAYTHLVRMHIGLFLPNCWSAPIYAL
jgi:hypothetical protein